MTTTSWPLRTMRLVLRPLNRDDIDTFVAYRRDPEVHPWQSWDGEYSITDAEQLVADVAATEPGTPGSWCQVAVLADRGSCLVGDVAFCVDADDPGRAMIGYTVAPEHQANGYATEAVAALLSWLADRGVGVVEADTLADNGPSRRVLERLGFDVAADLDGGTAVLYRRNL